MNEAEAPASQGRGGAALSVSAIQRNQHPSGAAEGSHAWCFTAVSGVRELVFGAIERHEAAEPVDEAAMPPARFSLEGLVVDDDWPNFQVDGYGTWLWSLRQHLQALGRRALPSWLVPAVELAAERSGPKGHRAPGGTTCPSRRFPHVYGPVPT